MHHSDNPENQQPHGLRNLVQISRKAYPQWVVVQNAGTDDESIVNDFYTYDAATSYVADFSYDFDGLDIMKRNPDGTLTTEH